MRIPFDQLPDHGRLWVFPAARALTPDESQALLEEVDSFLDTWAAHGAPLQAAREFLHDRFLVVGVDQSAEAPSGCSIDALVNSLRSLGGSLGVELIQHAPVWYRDAGGAVRTVNRSAFRTLAADGDVDVDTPVFDTSLTRVGDYRAGGLEQPARATWHGTAFFREQLVRG